MFDRIEASFRLARASWQVLWTDKQLIVFPILSGLGCLLVMIGFALPFVAVPEWLQALANIPEAGKVPIWVYPVTFAYYFCSYFVIVFFNAALVHCALLRFEGETPTLADGLSAAIRRLPQIVAWALVSATIGTLLKAIEMVHERLGQIVSMVLGTAWTVITYFVVPVLVVEGVGPFKAVSRSLAVLKETWGEALVGRLGLGLFIFLLTLPGILLLIAGFVVLAMQPIAGAGILVAALLYFALMSAVGSALTGIFRSALYHYAIEGAAPTGFDDDDMRGAFKRKR